MKKRKVYIFNSNSRAAVYGIGTYMEELISSLKSSNIEFEVVSLYSSEGSEVKIEEKDSYKQITIPIVRNIKYYLRNVVYILREFIPERADYELIFHLNFMTNDILVTQLRKQFKCKIILVAHYTNWSFDLMGDEKKLKIILEKEKRKLDPLEKKIVSNFNSDIKMIKGSDRFVCVAQHTLNSFMKNSDIKSDKAIIVNNALKDSFRQSSTAELALIRKKYFITPETNIILFAGRLDPVKGIKFLIKSFKIVLEQYPDSLLIFIGDGDHTGWEKEIAGYWTKIVFTGRLQKKQLYEFYQIANIGVVSSLHEEFGYVAIEMMMHQLPIVVTDTGGLSEIVEDNISGLKVPVQIKKGERVIDAKKMAAKIYSLLNNPLKTNEIARNGRERYLEKYNSDTFNEKMVALYEEI